MLNTCDAVCTAPPPDKCADDMHVVTEREWQELMARLKVLEIQRKAGLQGTRAGLQCLHDLGVCTDRMDLARKMVQNIIDESKAAK